MGAAIIKRINSYETKKQKIAKKRKTENSINNRSMRKIKSGNHYKQSLKYTQNVFLLSIYQKHRKKYIYTLIGWMNQSLFLSFFCRAHKRTGHLGNRPSYIEKVRKTICCVSSSYLQCCPMYQHCYSYHFSSAFMITLIVCCSLLNAIGSICFKFCFLKLW